MPGSRLPAGRALYLRTSTSSINDNLIPYQPTSNGHFGGLTSVTTPTNVGITSTKHTKITTSH